MATKLNRRTERLGIGSTPLIKHVRHQCRRYLLNEDQHLLDELLDEIYKLHKEKPYAIDFRVKNLTSALAWPEESIKLFGKISAIIYNGVDWNPWDRRPGDRWKYAAKRNAELGLPPPELNYRNKKRATSVINNRSK